MANLSGQTIQSTYPGLLNLNTATTGITSSYQQITDGFGNNTNTRISTSGITSPTTLGMYHQVYKPDSLGTGAGTGAVTPGAGSQSNLLFGFFYDTGQFAYSSMTVYLNTATSTADNVEFLIYDLQQVLNYGLFPKNQIISGVSLTTSGAVGFYTTTFSSALSMSGTGEGYYAYVLKYTNTGATPSVRLGNALLAVNNQAFLNTFGIVRNNAGTGFLVGNRAQTVTGANLFWLTNQTTPAVITEADVASRFNTTVVSAQFGFNLNVIR